MTSHAHLLPKGALLIVALSFMGRCGSSGETGDPLVGRACAAAADCSSGVCRDFGDGNPVCSAPCDALIPCEREGWYCGDDPDDQPVCTPDWAVVCRPCSSSVACPGARHLCVELDPGAPTCTYRCTADGDCPRHHECALTAAIDGGSGRACLPLSESCVCGFEELDGERPCAHENEHGSCAGVERCAGAGGWSDCDAPEAAAERCDGEDNDCDGQTDEGEPMGCAPFFIDADEDGAGSGDSRCLCQGEAPFTASTGNDCDDSTPLVHPSAVEQCDELDNNCDGLTDGVGSQGCELFYEDGDGDGHGAGQPRCLCEPDATFTVALGDDCDDDDPKRAPGFVDECDLADNDCDALIDEDGGPHCGSCGLGCKELVIGEGGAPFSPDEANSDGVTTDAEGQLVLMGHSVAHSYLWVANSQEDTLSKIDVVTGAEVGRYRVCNSPSRTAVDLDGDVYVACRDDGQVAKVRGDPTLCPDLDGDGEVRTSIDLDEDGVIGEAELLPAGQDECLAWIRLVSQENPGSGPRGLAVDRDNYCWVGHINELRLHRLDPTTGATVRTVSGLATGSYGLVFDPDGVLWISGRNTSQLIKAEVEIDPAVLSYYVPADKTPDNCVSPYGIAVDGNGRVWLGNYTCPGVLRFDPGSETFARVPVDLSLGATRGVAVSLEGHAYFAHHTKTCVVGRSLTRVDVDTLETSVFHLKPEGHIAGPVGVAFDFVGQLWTVNECTHDVTRINVNDPDTPYIDGTFPVGQGPYTYSDMSGYNLHTYTAPNGSYRFTMPAPGDEKHATYWQFIDVEGSFPSGTYLKLRFRASVNADALALTPWSDFHGPFPPEPFPYDLTTLPDLVGELLEVDLHLFSQEPGVSPKVSKVIFQYTID